MSKLQAFCTVLESFESISISVLKQKGPDIRRPFLCSFFGKRKMNRLCHHITQESLFKKHNPNRVI